MKWNGFWMAGALAVALAGAGCRMLGLAADEQPDAPALRLDRSAPYGDIATETPAASLPAESAEVGNGSAEMVGTNAAVLPSTGGASYRLRSGDTLIIHLRTTQLEQIESLVDENGDVKLPLIGTVHAAGLTASELENKIQKDYIEKKIYRYLTVHVLVPTRSYFVRGEVRGPGRFSLVGSVTVLQAIATAGGYTDFADLSDVRLTRGDKTVRLNAKEIERSPEKDLEVEAGDVIVVKRTWY
jgi:protein involved in polysaccharide export with SLBB domain